MMNLCGRLHAALQASTARPRGVKLNACSDEACMHISLIPGSVLAKQSHTHTVVYTFTLLRSVEHNKQTSPLLLLSGGRHRVH